MAEVHDGMVLCCHSQKMSISVPPTFPLNPPTLWQVLQSISGCVSFLIHLVSTPWCFQLKLQRANLSLFTEIWCLTFFPVVWEPFFLRRVVPETAPLECPQEVGPWRTCPNPSRRLWPPLLCWSTHSPWSLSCEVDTFWSFPILLVITPSWSPYA